MVEVLCMINSRRACLVAVCGRRIPRKVLGGPGDPCRFRSRALREVKVRPFCDRGLRIEFLISLLRRIKFIRMSTFLVTNGNGKKTYNCNIQALLLIRQPLVVIGYIIRTIHKILNVLFLFSKTTHPQKHTPFSSSPHTM